MKKVVFLSLLSMLSFLSCPSFALGGEVRIGVRVVLASHKGRGVHPSLHDIQKKLSNLFNYSSYQLLKERSFILARGQTGQLPLAGKKELRIRILQEGREAVDIAVEILRERKGIFKTKAKLKKGGTFLIGGPRHEEGVLILAISAQGP